MSLKIFTVAEMVAVEKAADASGWHYDQMMETAGQRTAAAIMARYPVAGKSVLVLVGPGNNGGDGLVCGRYLAAAGADVSFYLFKPRDPVRDINYGRILEMGLFAIAADFDQRYHVLHTRLKLTDILIDALLGTGATRPITGHLANLLQQVHTGNQERAATLAAQSYSPLVSVAQFQLPSRPHLVTVAIDCPSGLNCDTGDLDPLALPATLTVTFAGAKRGHFRFPGAAVCGELVVADIGIDATLPEVQRVSVDLITAVTARHLLPPRPRDGHKGTFGWALIAAGSAQYWGAPLLAARAVYRSGAGLVALAVPERIRATLAGQLPEATYPPMPDQTRLDIDSARLLLKLISATASPPYHAWLIGPGLGAAKPLMELLFKETGHPVQLPPLVIDADGLNLLAGMPNWPKRLPPQTILTPHPGEMARLMGASLLEEVKELDRIELARLKAQEWGHVVVLKGAYTVVAAPDGRIAVNPFANPILGTAGSGDVLAGVIVGLLAQKLPPYEAAVLGVWLHGAAGELASQSLGQAGLLAGELADWLPQVRQKLSRGVTHD